MTTRRTTLAALPLVLVIALSGCTKVTGEVIEKDADAATTKTVKVKDYRQDCTTKYKTVDGKRKAYQDCKRVQTGTHTEQRRIPADYDLTVRDAEGNEHEVEVSRAEFERYEVGDTYSNE